jgi:hypothetical protein
MTAENKDTKIQDLESKIENLTKTIKSLNDQLFSLEEQLSNIENKDAKDVIFQQFKNTEEKINQLTEDVTEVKDLKTQIFSVMALFFGIFTFIAVDIGFTKGIFDYFPIPNALSIIVLFIISQITFFTAIYFLLKRFAPTSNYKKPPLP